MNDSEYLWKSHPRTPLAWWVVPLIVVLWVSAYWLTRWYLS